MTPARTLSVRTLGVLALLSLGGLCLSAQAPDRGAPPAAGPAPTLALPDIRKLQLSNGVPVWIVSRHEVPVVQVSLLVRSGTSDDPPGQYGIASLMAAMLTEGAGARTSLEIADAVDFLGGDLSATSTSDSTVVRLHIPVARLADGLPIMADVALRPTFPARELERARQQRLTMLLQAKDDAASVVGLAFSRVLYGTAHRFGTATMGTTDTIRAFTPDDLRGFYRSTFRPDKATLLIVGDVTPDAALRLAETSFGGWKATGPAPAAGRMAAPAARTRREIYLIDKPGAPQTQIRIGSVGVARSTPDYFPIQVLNTMLGGAFSSRLNLNLREEHGYTYGAASVFDMRRTPGPFFATAGVQTDKTSEALVEFFKELDGMQTIPDEELARAKNYVALRFPGGFETTGDLSRRLEEVLTYELPDDYFSRYVQNIAAVGAADVQRVARAYIQTDKVAVVIVGDRAAIEPGIRALNLGPITLLTTDELFGK